MEDVGERNVHWLRVEERGSIFGGGVGIYPLSTTSQRLLGHPYPLSDKIYSSATQRLLTSITYLESKQMTGWLFLMYSK
jgi:hypothetical protein